MFYVKIHSGTRYDEDETTPLGLGFQLQIDDQIVVTMDESEYQMLVQEVMRSVSALMDNEMLKIEKGA